MSTTQTPAPVAPPEAVFRAAHGGINGDHAGLYFTLVVLAALVMAGYNLRRNGVFSCQANGYHADRYLAYCQATGYGDYDHGAFWFGLEPGASQSAAHADVLFLGNSRMQLGFSSKATDEWFTAAGARYFLMGFSHYVNVGFEAPLVRKLGPSARVYVINADRFFEQSESPPAHTVLRDSTARLRYEEKRQWQPVHRALCSTVPFLCGHEYVIYRSRQTGSWEVSGGQIKNVPVSYGGPPRRPDSLPAYIDAGRTFVASLPVRRECVVLALVPYEKTDLSTARQLADSLGVLLVAPQPDSLNMFDGGHLDRPSAERWSAAFLAEAGDRIRQCLAAPAAVAATPAPPGQVE